MFVEIDDVSRYQDPDVRVYSIYRSNRPCSISNHRKAKWWRRQPPPSWYTSSRRDLLSSAPTLESFKLSTPIAGNWEKGWIQPGVNVPPPRWDEGWAILDSVPDPAFADDPFYDVGRDMEIEAKLAMMFDDRDPTV